MAELSRESPSPWGAWVVPPPAHFVTLMSKTGIMTEQLSPEELERLSREISRADLQKLAERGLLGTPASPAAEPKKTSTGIEASRSQQCSAAEQAYRDGTYRLRRDTGTAPGTGPGRRSRRGRSAQAPFPRARHPYLPHHWRAVTGADRRTLLSVPAARQARFRPAACVRARGLLSGSHGSRAVAAGFILGTQITHLLGGGYNPPTLQESAAAPYGVSQRVLPLSDAQPVQLLPETLGEFPRSDETISANNASSPHQSLPAGGWAMPETWSTRRPARAATACLAPRQPATTTGA